MPSNLSEESSAGKGKRRVKLVVSVVLLFVALPIVIVIMTRLGSDTYYLTSVVIIVLMMLPFFLSFERRKPTGRELVVIAVLIALAVAGRAVFVFVPFVSPVIGLVILSGIALGSSSGFVVGALALFVSDFMFGQGPWTPWQMLAAGAAGWVFGYLAERGKIARDTLPSKKRLGLAVGAGLFDWIVVGIILNTCTLFTMVSVPTELTAIIAVYAAGLPVDLVRGISTALVVYFLANPLLGKFERVRVKYGLMGQ
jgi:energy-coupling factor transport system substrate-specific component